MSYKFPQSQPIKTAILDRFGGVDFTNNPTQVSPARSPDALNMIADNRFFPVKRTGYTEAFSYTAPIYALHPFIDTNGNKLLLIHSGTNLYLSTSPTPIYTNMAENRSNSFVMNGKLYILDGKTYLQYDGTIKTVTEVAFIPTTTIAMLPDGKGTRLEAVNLLQPKRKNSFRPDGTATKFKLDTDNLDSSAVTATLSGTDKAETTDFTVDRAKGEVTFKSAPPDSKGVDTLIITFSKTVTGYADKVNKCRFAGLYGGGNDTKVFISGNPNEKNVDWYSGTYDATYFPDDGRTKIGSDSSAIVGYIKQFDTQIILKEGNEQDTSQFLRSVSYDANNKIMFPVRQGVSGIGAISYTGSVLLEDIPLVLTKQGVYAVVGTAVSNQRLMSCRSNLINNKLLSEPNLDKAVMYEYKGKLYLCVNSHCYVADSQQTYVDTTIQYEWYYWDNIPATCFAEYNDFLYFGTQSGKVFRFYKDTEPNCFNDNGQPIDAYWTTPFINFNTWNLYKTVRNVHVVPLPYFRSGIEVYYNTEDILKSLVLNENIDLFSFDNLDFSRFTFKTIQAPLPYATGQKERKIALFQVVVRNARLNEPFGFLGIQISYTIGGKIK